jgi:ubiquinone/menaquinone biosynthesis C-methylase UbiE
LNTSTSLTFDGERFIPGVTGNIELEHLHRYALAQRLCQGKMVLDIACGEGYGSAMMAQSALSVIGMDISEQAIAHAQSRYPADNLTFKVGDCTAIALPDACVDLIVSFETIEHHDQHSQMLSELRRVLKPGGVLLMSSPDRFFYSEKPGTRNEHHVKELYEHEFKTLIERHFRRVNYYAQTVAYGSVIFAESTAATQGTYTKDGDTLVHANGLASPLFWLALASDGELPEMNTGLFEQPLQASELFCHMQRDLDNAVQMLRAKDESLEHAATMLQSKDDSLQHAVTMLQAKDSHLAHARDMLDARQEHLQQATKLLEERESQLARLNGFVKSLKRPASLLAFVYKTWIRRSDREGP